MTTIPQSYEGEPDLHHLQVLDVLLREHSLTRAARVLDVTQPALSKTLAHLRRYFDDPLFVRVALRMEPTPKALLLQAPVRERRTVRSSSAWSTPA
jgi:DNA-binding transcriptional LysR family regulator